jgi:DNA-binding transcriptional ArsR family regulator
MRSNFGAASRSLWTRSRTHDSPARSGTASKSGGRKSYRSISQVRRRAHHHRSGVIRRRTRRRVDGRVGQTEHALVAVSGDIGKGAKQVVRLCADVTVAASGSTQGDARSPRTLADRIQQVLAAAPDEPMTTSEIVKALGAQGDVVESASVSRALRQLDERGYVERWRDGRRNLFRLTAIGLGHIASP